MTQSRDRLPHAGRAPQLARATTARQRVCASACLAAALSAAAAVSAQPAKDPITCWWRTSAGAVAIGEPFDLVLTCSVTESRDSRVAADVSRLGPETIQLAPFEVLGGARAPDITRGEQRFFQYRYTLRRLDADAIGRDVALPDLRIPYRIETVDNGNVPQAGREREYVLTGGSIRILSLVPADVHDIRELAGGDLDTGASLRFRARILQIGAMVAGALGLVVLVSAIARAARRERSAEPRARAGLPTRAVLRSAIGELERVSSAAQEGWTDELTVRATQGLRIVAACAAGTPVSQQPASRALPTEGRIWMRHGVLKRQQVSVSAAATPLDLTRALESAADARTRDTLEGLLHALRTFTNACYSAPATADPDAPAVALAKGLEAARRIQVK